MRLASFRSLLAVLSIISTVGISAAETRQSHTAFETAVLDDSTSPYIVLVTVVDDRTRQASTGCSTASFLLGAIFIEKWGPLGDSPAAEFGARFTEAERIALENTAHVFRFFSERALANILPFPSRFRDACAEIAKGRRARVGDRSGEIMFGRFAEGPQVVWSSCPSTTYPAGERPSHEAGTRISVLIGPDGVVKETKIATSSGSTALDETIRSALSGCKFKPATIDGDPVAEATWVSLWFGNRARWRFPKPAESSGGEPR